MTFAETNWKTTKLRETFENISPFLSLSRFFLPPPFFYISTPVCHEWKNCDCTFPKGGNEIKKKKCKTSENSLLILGQKPILNNFVKNKKVVTTQENKKTQ
jgi:hypothetical protein